MEAEDDKSLCLFLHERTEIIVLGASGDLAKKKTYPALFDLFANGFLTSNCEPTSGKSGNTVIYGFARTALSVEEFRRHISSGLKGDQATIDQFLQACTYHCGSYGDLESFRSLNARLVADASEDMQYVVMPFLVNRLFYFAIPPNMFIPSAKCIRETSMSSSGWTRLIVEKPFGHNLESAQLMSRQLGELFTEDHLYRIDHYLGKEMVQ